MLNDILNAMVDMYYHRQYNNMLLDHEIGSYLSNGGSFPLLRKVDELAHFRAVELHYQENIPNWR